MKKEPEPEPEQEVAADEETPSATAVKDASNDDNDDDAKPLGKKHTKTVYISKKIDKEDDGDKDDKDSEDDDKDDDVKTHVHAKKHSAYTAKNNAKEEKEDKEDEDDKNEAGHDDGKEDDAKSEADEKGDDEEEEDDPGCGTDRPYCVPDLLHLNEENHEERRRKDILMHEAFQRLHQIVENQVKPLEKSYKYEQLALNSFGGTISLIVHSFSLIKNSCRCGFYVYFLEAEIFAKPTVLIMEPYKRGKSSLLPLLLGKTDVEDG